MNLRWWNSELCAIGTDRHGPENLGQLITQFAMEAAQPPSEEVKAHEALRQREVDDFRRQLEAENQAELAGPPFPK